jgi:hypothetical protein
MASDAPEPPPPAVPAVPGGTIARSVFFLRHAWALLRSDRALLTIAAVGVVLNAAAAMVLFGVGAALLGDRLPLATTPLALAVVNVPLTFLSIYTNVALLWVAQERMEGRPRTASDGFAVAGERLGAILAWSLLATGVGAALDWISEKLPFGGLVSALLGVVWSLATMFAVPVLVLEDVGARRAVRRSAEVFRARWGEGLTGTIAVGAIAGCAAVPGILLVLAAFLVGGPATVPLAILGGLVLGAGMALSRALDELFALALYRHQVLGAGSFGLEPSQLDAFIELKSRRG